MMNHKSDDQEYGFICPECSKDRIESWQEHHKELVISPGDYVKVRVQHNDSGDTEWMWAEVMHSRYRDDGSLQFYGAWRNDAVLGIWPKEGDPATFLRTDIADYCEQGDWDHYVPWKNPVDNHTHTHPHQIN